MNTYYATIKEAITKRSLLTMDKGLELSRNRWRRRKGDDDQWLFLPAVNRVKRIASSNKSGSFIDGEFAYEDLGSQEVDKSKHK